MTTIKEIQNAAVQDLRLEGLGSAHERYDLIPKLIGAFVGVGGALVMQVWLPGLGPWIARLSGGAIVVGAALVASKEGDAIEQGNMVVLRRYLDDSRINNVIAPYVDQLQQQIEKETEAKKPSPQVGAKNQNPSQQENPSQNKHQDPNQSPTCMAQTEIDTPEGTNSAQTTGASMNKAGTDGGMNAPQSDQPFIQLGSLIWLDGEHLCMVGLSGSSKTTTLVQSVPTDELVLYVTLKTNDSAPESWVSCRLSKFANLELLRQLDELCTIVEWLVRSGVKHRLIIDEALTILSTSKKAVPTLTDKGDKDLYKAVPARFDSLLEMYIRAGRGDGHYLGLVSQSPNGTDLFPSAKTMQGLKIILCAGEASSQKFSRLVDWAKQLYGSWLDQQNLLYLNQIGEGFWHFWLDITEQGQCVLHGTRTENIQVNRVQCPRFSYDEVMGKLRPLVKAEKPQPVTSAASPAVTRLDSPLQSDLPPIQLPNLSDCDLTNLPWADIAAQMAADTTGRGIKLVLGELVNVELVNGAKWQQYRDALANWLIDQPVEMQVALSDRYPDCIPRALNKANDARGKDE